MLVATTIFSLMMVGVLTLLATGNGLRHAGLSSAEAQHDATIAVQRAAREIRMAGYDPSGVLATLSNPTAVQLANASELRFVGDVTGDGVLDQVKLHLQGANFVREVTSWDGSAFSSPVSGAIADQVDSLTFSYFDNSAPSNVEFAPPVSSTDLANIRRITVSLTTTNDVVSQQRFFSMIVDAEIRN